MLPEYYEYYPPIDETIDPSLYSRAVAADEFDADPDPLYSRDVLPDEIDKDPINYLSKFSPRNRELFTALGVASALGDTVSVIVLTSEIMREPSTVSEAFTLVALEALHDRLGK